jgi:putative hydrolase of the HAD superfamily
VIRAILFDLYGTLIDIETDESLDEIYRGIAHFLAYKGIMIHRGEVRDRYYAIMKTRKEASQEEYPEIDVEAIWGTFLAQEGMSDATSRGALARTLSELHRGISRKRLRLYPGVKGVLDHLKVTHRLGLVSDAQPCFALPEIAGVGLSGYFDPIVISAPSGFRKPDRRLFDRALELIEATPEEAIYVGNDMFRDVFGASRAGLRTIFVAGTSGEQSHAGTIPDHVVPRFQDVLEVVRALS